MAFSGNFMMTSFKKELLTATHDFTPSTGDTFKLALYTNSADGTNFGGGTTTMDASITAYNTDSEVGASGSYSAGGGSLSPTTPTSSGTTAYVDFADLTFTSATITARGAVIYNSTGGSNQAVAALDFGSDKVSTAGDFQIIFPSSDASNAIIRIA